MPAPREFAAPARAAAALRWAIALLAGSAIAVAVLQLESATRGLRIERLWLGSTPVTVFRPPAETLRDAKAPVVLIAHGFAGSQQLMQPLALTLARNGFIAISFDFPGHGRNSAPLRGGLSDPQASQRTLLAAMGKMSDFARQLPGSDGRLALVGHSMASDIVVRHAQADPAVMASVGVSLFAPSIGADTPRNSPRNLLVITGAVEPTLLAREALRVVGPGAVDDTTYGRFGEGTARRATRSPGVEHIGVLYSAHTLAETLAWLNAAFDRPQTTQPFLDARGPWLALLLAGVLLLAWPLAQTLPCLGDAGAPTRPTRRWWAWKGQAALALLPALLTPLLLWQLPSDFLPILLGDYLVLHFALYGLLTFALLWWIGWRPPQLSRGRGLAMAFALLASSLYALLAVGVPVDRYLFNMQPTLQRLPLIVVLCAGTLPYFLADEASTRDGRAAPLAYIAAKLCFLLSLVLAIALNPPRLFFLAIIVPAILLLFVVYGLFSRWIDQRTRHPLVAATALALAFAAFIALSFPRVV
jgi:alpha-beta hydrolase superfamily lysophospholipase